MIKTVFSYILFYISCVNARYLRHLSYATGMEGPRNLRHSYKLFEKDIEEFTDIYESNY